MQFYQTVEDGTLTHLSGNPMLHTTLAKAQAHLKAAVVPVFRGASRIYLLDVPTDKAALAGLLNDPEQLNGLSFRIAAWRMTARGGLRKELAD